MSAFGTFPYYAPPKGLSNTVGVAPHPTFATQGAGETSCTLTTERCRLQPVKAAATRLLRKP